MKKVLKTWKPYALVALPLTVTSLLAGSKTKRAGDTQKLLQMKDTVPKGKKMTN
jgi:hypothetical protein